METFSFWRFKNEDIFKEMVNNKLENWLKDGLKKGYSIDELRKKALENYSEKDVDAALSKLKKKPKTFLWIIIVILLAGLIFAGYSLLKINLAQIQPSEEQIKECMKDYNETPIDMARAICSDILYIEIASNTSNSKYCEKIITEPFRSRCFDVVSYDLAVKLHRKEMCMEIKEEGLKEECTNRIK